MTAGETAQIITSIATLLGVIGGFIVQLLNGRKVLRGIREVHESTNGKMDKLLEQKGIAADALGEKRGYEAGLKKGKEESKP